MNTIQTLPHWVIGFITYPCTSQSMNRPNLRRWAVMIWFKPWESSLRVEQYIFPKYADFILCMIHKKREESKETKRSILTSLFLVISYSSVEKLVKTLCLVFWLSSFMYNIRKHLYYTRDLWRGATFRTIEEHNRSTVIFRQLVWI